MSAAKHTPGPWACDGVSEYTGALLVRSEAEGVNHGDTVARVSCYSPRSETPHAQAANARLIAAAPDLLAALQGLDEAYCRAGTALTRDERHEDRCRLIAARAAIAKATGEGA